MMSKVAIVLALSILLATNVEGKPAKNGVICLTLTSIQQCNACLGCTWYIFYCGGIARCGNKPPVVKEEHLKLGHQKTVPEKSSEEWDDLEDY
uniref:Uncharacterized protein n=1 Tax=Plectus sambesii TaxID=2011161 RepID=A0A914UXB5_9BILA